MVMEVFILGTQRQTKINQLVEQWKESKSQRYRNRIIDNQFINTQPPNSTDQSYSFGGSQCL